MGTCKCTFAKLIYKDQPEPMRSRDLMGALHRSMRAFPVVVVTGTRQSGKMTPLRNVYADTHACQSLEDPDIRTLAPRGSARLPAPEPTAHHPRRDPARARASLIHQDPRRRRPPARAVAADRSTGLPLDGAGGEVACRTRGNPHPAPLLVARATPVPTRGRSHHARPVPRDYSASIHARCSRARAMCPRMRASASAHGSGSSSAVGPVAWPGPSSAGPVATGPLPGAFRGWPRRSAPLVMRRSLRR